MLNIKQLLEEIKASPYEEIEIVAPHTGKVEFPGVKIGDKVNGPSGEWKEKHGTLLVNITRERNKKSLYAPEKGEIVEIKSELEGSFVEAGQTLLKIRHFLSKDEVLHLILKKALFLFNAPERAKYYFTPEIDTKIKGSGEKSVKVRDGLEVFIVSRMKRETPLVYSGPEGLVYSIYFNNGENVDSGQPLIGVCPEDQLKHIQDVVNRVQSEWEERE
ncbi:biotin attachment protein [Maridesulfovibrio bastinii]|uniref:biotin attachment protein n=1 Tax=Maridesulfovibrio bastinii TaxID=47157 RepID=UPI000404C691|nr:biotin attachment protein [Maridesulfovibrio bastinii]